MKLSGIGFQFKRDFDDVSWWAYRNTVKTGTVTGVTMRYYRDSTGQHLMLESKYGAAVSELDWRAIEQFYRANDVAKLRAYVIVTAGAMRSI